MQAMKAWRRSIGACALMVGLALGAAVPVVAQDQPADQTSPAQQTGGFDLARATVDLYAGTCATPAQAPGTEVGTLQPMQFGAAAPETGLQIGEAGESADTAAGVQPTDSADTAAGVDTGETADTAADAQPEGGDEPAAGAAGMTQGPAGGPTIWRTETQLDANFDEMFSEQKAIAIDESPDAYQNILACGDLPSTGQWQGQDQIVVGLNPVQGSGFVGFAVFEQDASGQVFGDNASGLTVYLFENLPTQLNEGRDAATSSSS